MLQGPSRAGGRQGIEGVGAKNEQENRKPADASDHDLSPPTAESHREPSHTSVPSPAQRRIAETDRKTSRLRRDEAYRANVDQPAGPADAMPSRLLGSKT